MPGFCANCGAAVDGPFCGACGQRTGAVPGTPAPAQSGGALKKIVLIGLAVVLAMTVISIAGVAYGVHWLRSRAEVFTGSPGSATVVKSGGSSCSLLPREDVAAVLGVTIDRSEEIADNGKSGCAYFTSAEAFRQLQEKAAAEAKAEVEAASKSGSATPATDNPLELLKHTKELEGVVKTITLSQAAQDGRVFAFTVDPGFGRSNWSTMRTTMSMVPGFEEIPGVADQAMVGAFGHALYALKGDTMVQLELMFVPESRTRGADLGRRIAGRL